MRTRGSWLLVANRFFPTFRAVLFLAAGAAKMSFPRVVFLGTVSAMAWNIVMVAIGYAVGGNVERLTALLSQYNRVAFIVLGVAVFGLVTRYFLKRRAKA
jgi:membrane protein DedA with SNARE-associated domain